MSDDKSKPILDLVDKCRQEWAGLIELSPKEDEFWIRKTDLAIKLRDLIHMMMGMEKSWIMDNMDLLNEFNALQYKII